MNKQNFETSSQENPLSLRKESVGKELQIEIEQYNKLFGSVESVVAFRGASFKLLDDKKAVDTAFLQRVWDRLEKESDIPQTCYALDPRFRKFQSVILLNDAREASGAISSTVVQERKDAERRRFYRITDDSIHLEHVDIAKDIVLNTLNNTSASFGSMGTFAHEISHRSNMSNIAYRVDRPVSESKEKAQASWRRERITSHLFPESRIGEQVNRFFGDLNFSARTGVEEFRLASCHWMQFMAEVLSDMSKIEVGAEVFSEGFTTIRVLERPNAYPLASLLPIQDRYSIETKLEALGSLGLKAPILGGALRNIILQDYHDARVEKPVRLDEFVNFEYLNKLFDDLLIWKLNEVGVQKDIVDPIDLSNLLDIYKDESGIRCLCLRRIVAEEALKTAELAASVDFIKIEEKLLGRKTNKDRKKERFLKVVSNGSILEVETRSGPNSKTISLRVVINKYQPEIRQGALLVSEPELVELEAVGFLLVQEASKTNRGC